MPIFVILAVVLACCHSHPSPCLFLLFDFVQVLQFSAFPVCFPRTCHRSLPGFYGQSRSLSMVLPLSPSQPFHAFLSSSATLSHPCSLGLCLVRISVLDPVPIFVSGLGLFFVFGPDIDSVSVPVTSFVLVVSLSSKYESLLTL